MGLSAGIGVLFAPVLPSILHVRLTMNTRPYLFYALTNSLCSRCLTKVEAKIIFQDGGVYLVKHCPQHGREEVLIADDIDYYRQIQAFIKPGEMPLRFNTPIKHGCPYDCGLCPDREQHSCLTLVELTERCQPYLSDLLCRFWGSGTEERSPASPSSQSRTN